MLGLSTVRCRPQRILGRIELTFAYSRTCTPVVVDIRCVCVSQYTRTYQYITVYHSIPQYTTVYAVYHSIPQYITVYHNIPVYLSIFTYNMVHTTVHSKCDC